MKYTLKKPIIIWCFVMMFLIGIVFGEGFNDDFLGLYLGRLTVITFRYAIIVITLLTDYLVFENLNHYSILCRYRSLDRFILKAITIETIITILLTITFNIPIIIFNLVNIKIIIQPTILFIINTIIIMLLFTGLTRFINLWINNRVISSSIVFASYVLCDFILENINFVFLANINFDLANIFILPYHYGFNTFIIIAIVIIFLIILINFVTINLLERKDYFILENENL